MKIGHSRSAAATPAFALIAEGWNELVQTGFTPDLRGDCPINWTNQVLYAEREDGELVGVICFIAEEITNSCYVTLAYVEPTSRRNGVFRELWGALVDKARGLKLSRIAVDTHAGNTEAHVVMKGVGVAAASVTYERLLEG